MADAHLQRAGITKGAGGFQREQLAAQFLPYAVADLEAADEVKRALKQSIREMDRHAEEVGRLVDLNGARIHMLAERYAEYAGTAVPGVTKVQTGLIDLDLEKYGVKLAERNLPDDGYEPFYPGHSADQAANNDGN